MASYDKLSGISGLKIMFTIGEHGDERGYFTEHLFQIESVNSIGFKQILRSWEMYLSEDGHNMQQGWAGTVMLISISDHLLGARLDVQEAIALRCMAK